MPHKNPEIRRQYMREYMRAYRRKSRKPHAETPTLNRWGYGKKRTPEQFTPGYVFADLACTFACTENAFYCPNP